MVLLTLALALASLAFPGPPDPVRTAPFSGCPGPTGASATVLIPALPSLAPPSGPLEPGDVLAVYAGGACVGSATWTGAGTALTVWADDPYTPDLDGFAAGDEPQIQVWDASTGTAHATGIALAFESGFGLDGGLGDDRVYVVAAAAPPAPPMPDDPVAGPPAPAEALVWISEVDAIAAEGAAYVEIQSAAPSAALPALTLVAVSADAHVYGAVDLGGLTADAGGYVMVRPEGAPDGPGVRMPGVTAFADVAGAFALYPTDQAPAVGHSVADRQPVDAVVSAGTGQARATALLGALGQSVQYVDASATAVSRLSGGTAGRASLFHAAAPSPGAVNPDVVVVDGASPASRADGFRLVSVPVLSQTGEALAVGDLAALNLVEGVPGSANPDAAPNVWTGFDGATGFVPAPSLEAPLVPGAGFMWHWAAPAGARASGAEASFHLAQSGRALDDAATGGPYLRTVPATAADGLYLVGNPYVYPLRASGLAVEGGTLQTALASWDPVDGTFVDLFTRPDTPEQADVLPVWGGAFAEVTGVEGQAFSLVSTSAQVDPAAAPGPAPAVAPRLSFELAGVLADGATVVDRSAHVRQLADGTDGWDRHDASKLTPPRAAYALVAPVGTRDGAPRRQRVLSLPDGAELAVPLAFTATGAGTFTLRWTSTLDADDLELVDLVLDQHVPLASASEYTFETGAPAAWSDRFEVRPATARSTASGEEPEGDAVTVGLPYPNPAATAATLSVRSATPQRVVTEVYDAMGRRVIESVDQAGSGQTQIRLDAGALAPGLYVVRVSGETFAETRRMTVVR